MKFYNNLAKVLLLFLSALLFFGFAKNSGDKNKTQKLAKANNTNDAVESYYMRVNKLLMPTFDLFRVL